MTATKSNLSAAEPRSVVAAFEDRNLAEEALDVLRQHGFRDEDIGFALRGSDVVHGGMITDAPGAKDIKGIAAGAMTGGVVGGTLAAVAALLIPGVGPVVAGGILAAFFGGTIAGTAVGGIVGALTGLGVSEHEAVHYEKQFHEGKAIVVVRAGDRAAEAASLLMRHGGHGVHSEMHNPIPLHGLFSTP
jgi:rhodanese-related sulfurtransferase